MHGVNTPVPLLESPRFDDTGVVAHVTPLQGVFPAGLRPCAGENAWDDRWEQKRWCARNGGTTETAGAKTQNPEGYGTTGSRVTEKMPQPVRDSQVLRRRSTRHGVDSLSAVPV